MDPSQPSQNQPQPQPTQSTVGPESSYIRPDHVNKLPHLSPGQKQQYETIVRKLWDILKTTQPSEPRYQNASLKLSEVSASLMTGMRQFQTQRRQQMQAQQQQSSQPQQAQAQAQTQQPQQAAGSGPQAPPNQQNQGPGNNLTFAQLLPDIQQRVNQQHFYFPPAMVEGTKQADEWLREAKIRFGQALQRLQIARNKKMDMQKSLETRNAQGNPLNPQEQEAFNAKAAQCQKVIQESQSFMEKFKEQQLQFQRQQTQNRFSNNAGESNDQPSAAGNVPSSAAPGPQAHSISSAVNAARNQANQAAAANSGSPTAPNPANINATPGGQQNQVNPQQSPYHSQQGPMDPSTAAIRPASHHGHSTPNSAIQQHHPQSAVHAHPLSNIPSVKPPGPAMNKNINVTEPKAVPMAAGRPTLNGGGNIGVSGVLGRPAIDQLPGYALEFGEDERLLSKKKLNELVREVCGPGNDQLSPEAEEIFLNVADDFVDDLLSAACKLAKVRGSNVLEVRDILIVLERQYNIRIPGYSTDEVRTVRRPQPAAGWAHKMSAVQAAKLTGGGSSGAPLGLTKDG